MPVKASAPQGMAARLLGQLDRLGFDQGRQTLGLAVSGGGDSMAMLHLAHSAGLRVAVASVDHGLRPDSAAEAAMVGQVAQGMGLPHSILRWQGWDGQGNVQDRARRARRALLAAWAKDAGLGAVALAHSQDDVAETYLMRLARGAGVDGLAAMQARFVADGVVFLRPLLDISRADLREYLRHMGGTWVDDPSNDQTKYARVRARRALPALQKLGLGAQVLADVAGHMRSASMALDFACDDLLRVFAQITCGIVTLRHGWQSAPPELQRRLLQRVVLWIVPADYPPRGAALMAALARLGAGAPCQLAGCHLLPHGAGVLAFREARRAAPPCEGGQIWDGVWQLAGAALPARAQIGPLGQAGLAQWHGWRDLSLPRAALLSQPSLWAGGQLLATPLRADLGQTYAFFRHPAADSLICATLSH